MFKLQLSKLVRELSYHRAYMIEKFAFITYSQIKLCHFKVAKLDAYIQQNFMNEDERLVSSGTR